MFFGTFKGLLPLKYYTKFVPRLTFLFIYFISVVLYYCHGVSTSGDNI